MALVGCGQTLDLRDPLPDSGPSYQHHLEVLTEQPLRLTTLETTAFEVRYTDADGDPVEGASVELLLAIRENSPGTDATLGEALVLTDADGAATGTVQAGMMAASFRIRASAHDADSVYVDVSVSDAGFGDLEVMASYAGTRSPDALAVMAFGQSSCAEAWERLATPDREEGVAASGGVALFESLPAGLTYAVATVVRSESGAVVAWGCEDGVEVPADDVASASVVAVDLPLDPKGLYSGDVLLDAPTAPATVEAALAAAAAAAVSDLGADGDATLMLTGLPMAMAAFGETTCATNLSASLATAIPLVQDELDASATGVDEALAAAASDVASRAARLKVSGALSIVDGMGGGLDATYQVTGLAAGADDGSALVPMDVASLALDASLHLDGSWSVSRDTFTVTLLEVPLPLSRLVEGLLAVATAEAGAPSTGAWLGGLGPCDALAASPTLTGLGCSADGLASACALRLDAAVALLLLDGAPTLDAERATVAIAGTLTWTDADDDRLPEAVAGSVTGAWTGPDALDPDAVTGTLDGARVGGATALP